MVGPTTPKKNYVLKRDARQEEVHIDKITSRIQKLCYGLNMDVIDPVSITLKVIRGLYPGVKTTELDSLAAETAMSMVDEHPEYATLAARMEISNLQKETKKHFSEVVEQLFSAKCQGRSLNIISEKHYNIIMKNANRLNSVIIYDRDFFYNYFEIKKLEASYLLRVDEKIVERPQHMLMRTAVAIHGEDIDSVIETYNFLSERYFVHASTTLGAACASNGQLSSLFSLSMTADSIDGIFDTVHRCATLSKYSGGIGLNVHAIRAKNTYISGTNGVSNGLVPMLKIFNDCAKYFSEGGRNQPGAFTIYLEPWHSDIFEFLNLKKSTGIEEFRARDMYYALWIPDLFMKRVEADGMWSLMCPHKCPGLQDCWGEEFEKLYEKYERNGEYTRQIRAQELWKVIVASQIETGTPYILYKDACNKKSNQKNAGTIQSSSIYGEIVQFCSPDEIGVGNLAWISLTKYVESDRKSYNFEGLKKLTKVIAKNLNKLIDVNNYPLEEARVSALKYRPISIGISGLANVFLLMHLPYESDEALLLNQQIMETIYYGALEASCELAEVDGTYSVYKGSPISQGILQYDMWCKSPTDLWDWNNLKRNIAKHGVRNSVLVAISSISNTYNIFESSETVQPCNSYVSAHHIFGKNCYIVNEHLINDLTEINLWNDHIRNEIIENRGSLQNVSEIPQNLKEIYKTIWEVKQKTVINMTSTRGMFVDQSESLNIHIPSPTVSKITSMHFYGWKQGLKTGMRLLYTNPPRFAVDNLKTVQSVKIEKLIKKTEDVEVPSICSLQIE